MDLEVLTTSAEEWCRTKDVELEDYNQIGVHYINSESNYPLKMEAIPPEFLSKTPERTEVIVGYNEAIAFEKAMARPDGSRKEETFFIRSCHGTALVKK